MQDYCNLQIKRLSSQQTAAEQTPTPPATTPEPAASSLTQLASARQVSRSNADAKLLRTAARNLDKFASAWLVGPQRGVRKAIYDRVISKTSTFKPRCFRETWRIKPP